MASRYILPTLAVASRAFGEVCSGTSTIKSQAEATAIATCNQFTGDIVIAAGASGDIDISGLQRLDGSLSAVNANSMSSLTADTLSTISGSFILETVSALTSLNFPSLVAVDTIKWTGLPVLSSLSFTQSVQKANNLLIGNTYLSNLDGIDLTEIAVLEIVNNRYLTDITMQLGNVTSGAVFSANGQDLSVSFPNLVNAKNMLFENVTSLSMPSLAGVSGSLGLRSNYFSSFSAPNLTEIVDSLGIISNPALTSLSFPELKAVGGGIAISNNTKLAKIDCFPRLVEVLGAINFYGTFSSVVLPQINRVRGAFNVESTSSGITSDCSHFKSIAGPDNDIQGTFNCHGSTATKGKGTTTASSSSSASSSTSTSSSSKKSGANSLLIPFATGIIGIVAAIFGML